MKAKKKILFVCVRNSARSQMAEGILRHLYGECYEAHSAGTEPTGVHALAVEALREIGIDISRQRSKGLDDLRDIRFDLVVTVCAPAAACPLVPGAGAIIRRAFDDPAETPDIGAFRRVRDELFDWIRDAFRDCEQLAGPPRPVLL